jgi:ABC-2 type transport system ATP-binding protein
VAALKELGIKAKAGIDGVAAEVKAGAISGEEIVRKLVRAKVGIKEFTLLAPTLEERFVLLTGEGFDVAR